MLKQICKDKLNEIANHKAKTNLAELEVAIKAQANPKGFFKALQAKHNTGQVGLIAEVKKASPSKGLIRESFNPIQIAQDYARAGATCISILTDEPYFKGRLDYLKSVAAQVDIPVLRKDFMLDTYQVTQARSHGADAILIIMAAVSDGQAHELEQAAIEYGMDSLIEVHDERELERALKLKSKLIGINNRNLKTFETNLNTSIELSKQISSDYIVVCESGIKNHTDIQNMQSKNINCFLVGEHLMRQADIYQATKELIDG